MAGLAFTVSANAATAASTAETLLQIVAATNTRVKINRVTISGVPTSSTEAKARVRVLKQTGAGTSSAATLVKKYEYGETLQTTARSGFSGTEPTAGDVLYDATFSLWSDTVPPVFPLWLKGGERLGIEITPGSGSSPTIYVHADCEE